MSGETAEAFEQRVIDNLPVSGPPGTNEFFVWIVSYFPSKDSDPVCPKLDERI
jgi:hypothetical protein